MFCLFQAEALRGDPEGFAQQQLMLNNARELVALAQAKVAELEANTPSLEEVLLCVAYLLILGPVNASHICSTCCFCWTRYCCPTLWMMPCPVLPAMMSQAEGVPASAVMYLLQILEQHCKP